MVKYIGTEKDERDLKQAWEFLGCKDNVEIKRDLNKVEMTQALKSFRDNLKCNNPDYCVICILVIILSHSLNICILSLSFDYDI